jgi:Ca2+-binding EF-hand superfamily protein
MDRDCDGFLDLEDIREFLALNGFFATERELQGIMSKCDKNNNGRINFSEFVDEFSPKLGH